MHLLSHLKTKAVIILTLIAISFSAYAQAPNLLNYQGVARNAVGNPLPKQTMNLRLSVHNLTASGATVYTETRVVKTNLGGLFSVQIGSAGTTSATGTIDAVNWLSGDKYLQVEIDPASNNYYLNMGTVQLVSVPYAFSAGTAGNSATVTTNANLTGSVTSIGNATSIAASPSLTGVPTAPTAAPGTNTNQIATTEFVKAAALTGPTGAKGVQGLAGADGAAGAQGIQGIQGLTGSVANVAAISGTSTTNGASITSGSLSLAPADATNGGIVTNGAQIFAGAKTFNTIITGSINGNATTAGTASTATKLATARNINGVAFDGSGDIAVTADAGTLTGTTLKSTVTSSSLTSVGTITSGVWSGTAVAVQNGGTGLTSTPENGQIDIGNGTGFTRATLTAGTGISIATGAGTITITNTSGLPTTFAPGDMLYWDGSAWVKVAHGLNGQSLFSNNGVPTWGTLVGAAVGIVSAGEILSPSGRIWMDRNLGATRVATSNNDYLAYGNLYQWGRGSDGHQLINWSDASTGVAVNATTSNKSSSNQPVNALFIIATGSFYDWRVTSNSSPWDEGVGGINVNPCPTGFSVPSIAEWRAEELTFISAFSRLKLTAPGLRSNTSGILESTGYAGVYWSKSVTIGDDKMGQTLYYSPYGSLFLNNQQKAYGSSVRCIKD